MGERRGRRKGGQNVVKGTSGRRLPGDENARQSRGASQCGLYAVVGSERHPVRTVDLDRCREGIHPCDVVPVGAGGHWSVRCSSSSKGDSAT